MSAFCNQKANVFEQITLGFLMFVTEWNRAIDVTNANPPHLPLNLIYSKAEARIPFVSTFVFLCNSLGRVLIMSSYRVILAGNYGAFYYSLPGSTETVLLFV